MRKLKNGGPAAMVARYLWDSFWIIPFLTSAVSVSACVWLTHLDQNGLSSKVESWGAPWNMSAFAANEVAEQLIGVQAAFLTLYCSITLLVVTLAASSLGVRLVERWLSRIDIRITLAVWVGLLTYTLTAMLFVDAEGASSDVPRVTLMVSAVLTILALGWLAVAFYRLARTVHVDTSIDALGEDFCNDGPTGRWSKSAPDIPQNHEVLLDRSGYITTIDRDELTALARKHDAVFRFAVSEDRFVCEGETLLWSSRPMTSEATKAVREAIDLGKHRADRASGPFVVTLLVEIANRALSPAVNDPYTALAVCDQIGRGLRARVAAADHGSGWLADNAAAPRVFVPNHDVFAQVSAPLAVLRREVCKHPEVACRLLGAYGLALARAPKPEHAEALCCLIEELADDAIASCANDDDRAAIGHAKRSALKARGNDGAGRPLG